MQLIKLLLLILVFTTSIEAEHDHDKIAIWSFREDNKNNVNVKAEYIGQDFSEPLGDFTLCFRYKVLYFNTNTNGIQVINAKSEKESFELKLYNSKSPNKIGITTKDDKRQVFWFSAEVPLR